MLAIARGGRQSYALSIQDEIKTHGHALTLGVLYTVLNRLERRGLIRHRDGDPAPERGDRPKRYYSLLVLVYGSCGVSCACWTASAPAPTCRREPDMPKQIPDESPSGRATTAPSVLRADWNVLSPSALKRKQRIAGSATCPSSTSARMNALRTYLGTTSLRR